MARHEPGWVCGSHTGSALRLLSRSVFEPLLGVMVSMTCSSVKASPCQWKCASRSPGARVVRAPTMNRSLASSNALRFDTDSMPASATTTSSSMPWAAKKARARQKKPIVVEAFSSIEGLGVGQT